jgi:hypothetical protein
MPRTTTIMNLLTSAVILSFAAGGPARAQESAPASTLDLELNAAQPSDKGCRLTFVVANHLGKELSKAAFEIALFNDSGVVDRLTVLDFKELPVEKTKVTRFDLSGVECAKISRILINQSTECAGDGIEPAACLTALKPTTKTGIAFGL